MATVAKVGLLLAMTLWAYSPLRSASYVWEDGVYAALPPLHDVQRVPWMTIGTRVLDYQIGHGEPWAAHAVSLGVHLVNGLLVWMMARRLSATTAWVAAAVFLLHPLNSEAVSYVTGRSDLLLTTCALGVAVVLRAPMTWWRWSVGGLLALGGMTTKDTGITVALVLLLLARQAGVSMWGALSLGLGVGAIAVWRTAAWWGGLQFSTPFGPLEFAAVQTTVIWQYVAIWVTPFGLSIDHDIERISRGGALTVALATVGIGGLLVWGRAAYPVAALGAGWIAVTVLPRLLVRSPEFLNERQFYLSTVGLALMTGATVTWAQRRRLSS